MSQIDLGRSFKAFFADKDWITKTLLGFVWLLLGVTAPAVAGAQLKYIRGVSEGNEELPDWSDFGSKWVAGFLVFVAGFIYFLPVVLLGTIFVVPAVFAAISGGDSDVFGALLGGSMCVFLPLAVVYSVAVSVLFSAAMTNYAMKGTFGALFEFGAILQKVRGGSGYFTAWLFTIVIAFIGSVVTSALSATGVGGILAPAITYFTLMASGHVLGQWAANAYTMAPSPAAPAASYPPPPPAYQPPPAPPAPVAPVATPAAPAAPAIAPAVAPAPPTEPAAPAATPVAPSEAAPAPEQVAVPEPMATPAAEPVVPAQPSAPDTTPAPDPSQPASDNGDVPPL